AFAKSGDEEGVETTNEALADIATQQGRLDEATRLLRSCVATATLIGAEPNQASALNLLANVLTKQGDLARAPASAQQALAAYRAIDDEPGQAMVLANLGNAELELGAL